MDFIDFLEMVVENSKVDRVEIYPLGTVGKFYKSNSKDIVNMGEKNRYYHNQKQVWIIDQ